MKKNVGSTDKIIRLVIAAIIAGLYFTGNLTGTWAIVGLVVLAITVLTSLVGVCPLYSIIGMSTDKK